MEELFPSLQKWVKFAQSIKCIADRLYKVVNPLQGKAVEVLGAHLSPPFLGDLLTKKKKKKNCSSAPLRRKHTSDAHTLLVTFPR